jgi:hypothetical protein
MLFAVPVLFRAPEYTFEPVLAAEVLATQPS